jgi:N-acetylmuramoyl-L-alanine amidase
MRGLPPRERETQDLIDRFRTKRARRRRLHWAVTVIVALVIIGAIVTAVVLAAGSGNGVVVSSSTSSTATTTAGIATGTSVAANNGATTSTSVGGTTSVSFTTSANGTTSTSHVGTTSSTVTTADTTSTSRTTTTAKPTTTTVRPTTTTTAKTTATSLSAASAKVVVIDPGHQAHANSGLEPVGPGSSTKKAKVSSGTAGVVTGIPESKLVLTIGLKLRDALKAHGIKVVMTRTSQDVDLSNIARAQIANAAHANLFVRIHADGTTGSSTSGIHVLYPATIKGWTDDIATASKKAASIAQRDLIAATGAKDRGIDARSDMTGFNWSDVPVILPEIGFMSNPAEDKLLATPAYQDKIVAGLTRAILAFLGAG